MIFIDVTLLQWYAENGRHDLPWRQTRDSYRLWLAEIMLQQTQVESVKPYYRRFLEALPTWEALAAAPQDQIMALWSGLGYYTRARNAQRAAQAVMTQFAGRFPDTQEAAETLPGVGRSTAAAVLASAYGQQQAILDANARRVLIRTQAIRSDPKANTTLQELWKIATALTPVDAHNYNQAIQDLGAMICIPRRPRCQQCPLSGICLAQAYGLSEHLPVSVIKPPKPERYTFFLRIKDGEGRILLEKRPDTGIWGGLWCLPQYHPEATAQPPVCTNRQKDLADTNMVREELRKFCVMRYGLAVDIQSTDPVRKHGFTHYQLYFRCVHARCTGERIAESALQARWYTPDNALKEGLPTPIRRILSASD